MVLVVGGLFAYRPAPVLGVNGSALDQSVGGLSTVGKCKQARGGRWSCRVGGLSSEDRPYVVIVEVDGFGCWSQIKPRRGTRSGRSGCLTIFDY